VSVPCRAGVQDKVVGVRESSPRRRCLSGALQGSICAPLACASPLAFVTRSMLRAA
jgi:hypothetical protein